MKSLDDLSDGLYQVKTKYFTAGFEVKNHKIVKIAPVLIKNINFWISIAKKVK